MTRPAVASGFTIEDFTVTIPASRPAGFSRHCTTCPVRHHCTTGANGRMIKLHPYHLLLVAARVSPQR